MDKDSFYRPSSNVKDTNRTYVPDLYRQVVAEMQEEDGGIHQEKDSSSSRTVMLQNRPIVGVLFSISAGLEGELFPVYVGRNTIGSDLSCDICLRETSVSALHAILLSRKQTDEDGKEYVNVILSDNNSSCGTCVNDMNVDFERVSCVDGDMITIGRNYVLVLSLFNAIGKLSVACAFERMPEPKKVQDKSAGQSPSSQSIIGGMSLPLTEDHSTNITKSIEDEDAGDFYKPTKQSAQDHYNNKTIIL